MKTTIQRVIEIPLDEVRAESYEATVERLGEHENTCFICGKRIKGKSPKMVHYLNTGNIVSWGGDDIENSQGMFPVGNDCAKKLVIQFVF